MALFALGLYAAPSTAQQAWPSRPIRFIIGFPPGGLNDVIARLYNDQVGAALRQPVVLEHKPGATGRIAMAETARSAPDGYTLALGNSGALTVLPNLFPYSELQYEPVKSFIPVTALGQTPIVMVVRADSSARSWKELLQQAKAKPMTHGSLGLGSPHQLAFEFLKAKENLEMTHVPFKGSGEQTVALLGGQVDVGVDVLTTMLPLMKSGKLRALAVASAERVPQAPDVPTLTELGYGGAVMTSWYIVLVPAGTPAPIVDRLTTEYRKASESDSVREFMNRTGVLPFPISQIEIPAAIKKETERWGRLIKERNITVN
jgi:tripartite-type tricarboxylate transporter receptor subunit TctC